MNLALQDSYGCAFMEDEDFLRQRGVEVIVMNDANCVGMMRYF